MISNEDKLKLKESLDILSKASKTLQNDGYNAEMSTII